MNKKNRKCAVCRTEYSYCPHCGEDKDKPTWYFTFCSSNCKDIYDVTSKFENRQLTIGKAKKMLDTLDLSKLDNFGDSYKSSVAKINVVEETVKVESITDTGKVDAVEEIKQSSLDNEEVEIKKPKKAKKNVE